MKPLGRLATLLVTMACALPAIAQYDETAKRFHVFPQIADGGGWQSVLLVTNVAQSSSFCTFELHGLTTDRFEDASGVTTVGSTATFSLIAPAGYLVWPTKNAAALASGYATLDCTDPVVAQVLYASRDGSGTTTGMATVFSSQAGGGFQFPVLTPDARLGIATANDTNTDASCRVVLENVGRQNLGEATLPVPSKSNVAGFLYEAIQVPDGFTEGSATVSCDQQVSVIGLQFAGAIFTTLPPAVLDLPPQSFDETAKRFHVFPQIADGDGWQSFLLVTSVSQSSNLCTLELHGLSVDRFEDRGTTATGSTATFSLTGPAGYLVWPTKNESTLATGYATLDCTDPVVAQVLYASRDGSGTTTGMATVFSSQAGGVFQFPVLTPEATLGIAIANDTNMEASCRFVLESPEQENLGQATLPVPSKSNEARFLYEAIQVPDGFTEGSATISCDQQVSVIGLQFDGAIFTTLPAAVLSTTPRPLAPAPPLMSDGTLTPGQFAAFRLGPVATVTLFLGKPSFRLEVPENASRVIFTLESVDPDVDVNLYVRFGQNNAFQDGRIITDHRSSGPTGNEQIVITPSSDPALRAGTYFVSLGLFDTGVVAEGTLLATVEFGGATDPLYLPYGVAVDGRVSESLLESVQRAVSHNGSVGPTDSISLGTITYFLFDGTVKSQFGVTLILKGVSKVQRIVHQGAVDVRTGTDGSRTWHSLSIGFSQQAVGHALHFIESQTVRSVRSFLDYENQGLTLREVSRFAGGRVVEATGPEGHQTDYIIDDETSHVTQLRFLTGGARYDIFGNVSLTGESYLFSDFRDVDGTPTPFKVERRIDGWATTPGWKFREMVFTSVSHNTGVSDSEFRP